jgi:hypothetical protein
MRGGVFICYRRDDSAGFAGRIYDRLKHSLGRDSVFIDVESIPAGRDFVEVLSKRVGQCDALIALIGRNWLASSDKDNRRLDDPNDFVRIEIEAALRRNVPVIPVLIDGAVMPQAGDLPDALKSLALRQGIEISHNRFDSDAERLIEALAGIDGEPPQSEALEKQPLPPPRRLNWLVWPAAGIAFVLAVTGVIAWKSETGGGPGLQAWAYHDKQIKIGTEMCLDVPVNDQTVDSTKVQVWDCTGSDQQKWTYDGKNIKSNAGMCLDVPNDKMTIDGTVVQIWTCHEPTSTQQEWAFVGGGIRNGGGKCLDLPESYKNWTQVRVWECNNSIRQASMPR